MPAHVHRMLNPPDLGEQIVDSLLAVAAQVHAAAALSSSCPPRNACVRACVQRHVLSGAQRLASRTACCVGAGAHTGGPLRPRGPAMRAFGLPWGPLFFLVDPISLISLWPAGPRSNLTRLTVGPVTGS
jgi:hypothetical protein